VYETWEPALEDVMRVVDSSHTPQGAFGYLLSLIQPRPRLSVATHFPTSDDTVECALRSVRAKVPDIGALGEQLTWSTDLMVLTVTPDGVKQMAAIVSDYEFGPLPQNEGDPAPPKYAGPRDQLDVTNVIDPGPDTHCESGY
jgi:ribonuclease Z